MDLTNYLRLEKSSKAQHFSAPPTLPPKVLACCALPQLISCKTIHWAPSVTSEQWLRQECLATSMWLAEGVEAG